MALTSSTHDISVMESDSLDSWTGYAYWLMAIRCVNSTLWSVLQDKQYMAVTDLPLVQYIIHSKNI